jgi:hypothetical protein
MSRSTAGGSRSEQVNPHLSSAHPYAGMQPPTSYATLPPIRATTNTPPTPSDRRGNPFHSILNPQADLVDQQRDRRRSGSHLESPSPVGTQHSQSLPSISRPTSVDSTHDERHPPRPFQAPGRPPPRHLPSPKSPQLHRTHSLTRLPPTGTIDAHQSPFLTASTRPSEPMVTHQPLPTPPAGGRTSYFPQDSVTGPPPSSNVMRSEARRPSIGFLQSGSASPIAQYSPYSQPASIASSQFDTPTTPGHYQMRHNSVQMYESRHSSRSGEPERNMIPMSPSGQSSIQLMTIKSQQGHNVQIPVDVQAASKVADEKRRRNAGASARFRARRKEKELEASMSISRLEQQLRDAIEDAEFYRGERDYFKSIVYQQPLPERHYTRPPSPRLTRPSLPPSLAPSSTRGGSEDSYADYEEEMREEERNVRRRTSNYHPVPGPAPSLLSGPEYQSAFPPDAPASAQGSHPIHQAQAREPGHAMSSQQSPSDRPIYRDPFLPDNGRFENRS